MKFSTAKMNVKLLTQMWDLVMKMDEMPTGHFEDIINEGLADLKKRLIWSVVYHLTDYDEMKEVLFEGPNADCVGYVLDHPELRGCCVIIPM